MQIMNSQKLKVCFVLFLLPVIFVWGIKTEKMVKILLLRIKFKLIKDLKKIFFF